MAQPASYTPGYDYSEEDTNIGAQLDIDFNALKATLDTVLANLELIQRDDTELKNDSVHPYSLSDDTLTLIAATWSPQGAWAGSTVYAMLDLVVEAGVTYLCGTAHTSGTFSTDLASGYWIPLGGATTTLLGLSDLPSSYAGSGEYFLKVTAGEDGIEFVDYSPSLDVDVFGINLLMDH